MGLGFEFEMTGRQNIKMAMLYNNTLYKYSKELEQEVIDFTELGDKIDVPLKIYSSGMLSRLAFATSIMQHGDILLLDEVFAAGDKHFIEKSISAMKKKIDASQICIVVTHDQNIVREMCTRAILLQNGAIIADDTVEKVLQIYNQGSQ